MAHRYVNRKAEENRMVEQPVSQEDEAYVRKVLNAYRQTPGTTGKVHPADRRLVAELHRRGVPLTVVENALLLATARRLLRSATVPPLATVRSLAYFLPVIEEVLALRVSPNYFEHIRRRIQRLLSA
jgi:hypothetical protein